MHGLHVLPHGLLPLEGLRAAVDGAGDRLGARVPGQVAREAGLLTEALPALRARKRPVVEFKAKFSHSFIRSAGSTCIFKQTCFDLPLGALLQDGL